MKTNKRAQTEIPWLAEKLHVWHSVDVSVRWQEHHAHILKERELVQGLSNPALFVHEERDVRLLVHGDDFMVEMPTHEETWFESDLFLRWKAHRKVPLIWQHCNGSFVRAPSDPFGSHI